MFLDARSLIPLFAIFLYAVLFAIVFINKPQTREKTAFRLYLIVMVLWSITGFFVTIGVQNHTTWFRLMTVSILALPIAAFHLVQVTLQRPRRWAFWVYGLLILSMPITLVTDWVVKWARVDAVGIHYEFNTIGIVLVSSAAYLIYTLSIYDLIKAYNQTDDPQERTRKLYLVVGLGIIVLFSLVNYTPLGKYPIDIAGNVLAAVVLAYAVLKHKLLDIDVVIRKSLTYFFPTTIIGAIYFFIISLVIRVFSTYGGGVVLTISMVAAIVSAIIVQPVRDAAQAWIDKLFFREKYDSNLMLQRVSRSATSFLEINMLANMILDEIVSTLHIDKAAFFLKESPNQDYRLVTQRNLDSNANIRFKPDHPLVVRLDATNQVITKRDIRPLPEVFKVCEEDGVIDGICAELFVPLKVQGNLIGFITLGEKKSEQPYSQDDQAIVIALANQTAIAIENARLYKVEQSRRKEMDTLYTLSRELVATDDLETVLNKVTEHVLNSIHVTFARILIRDEEQGFICRAIQPVAGLNYDLRLGEKEPAVLHPIYERVLKSKQPVVLEAHRSGLSEEEVNVLLLEHVHSLLVYPLVVGEGPIGLMILGERRHANREPFDADKLRMATSIADQASSAIQRARLRDLLEENLFQTVIALANALDARDSYTSGHSNRLVILATAMAKHLNCTPEEIQAINWSVRLHDIGKIGVPDEILRKPGKLTPEEWEYIKKHPDTGARILAPVKRFAKVAPIVRAHHEWFDGSGYPAGLKGEEIPLGARILSVADTYGAITDDRVYRKARSHEEALEEIIRFTGKQFDPIVVKAFLIEVDRTKRGTIDPDQENPPDDEQD
jgi:HD-GYP domain-containing protein (c-di-GMP phosphodiesterase class II)